MNLTRICLVFALVAPLAACTTMTPNQAIVPLQAATALGYTRWGRLFKVELPIAVPVISAGVRVAVVANVSIVAIAGTIGMANLGALFDQGFKLSTTTPYYPPIVLGIVLCVLLALVLDILVVLLNRMLTPWRRAVQS